MSRDSVLVPADWAEKNLDTPGVVFVEGLIGSTYLERDDDLIRYQTILRKLESIALSPQGSLDVISGFLQKYKGSLEAV